MSNNFQSRSTEDLQVENEFIKMKLMLEKGARFGSSKGAPPLPPDIENMFLKNIMAIEAMTENGQEISIFDKIGQPSHFKPLKELQEHEVETAWLELHQQRLVPVCHNRTLPYEGRSIRHPGCRL